MIGWSLSVMLMCAQSPPAPEAEPPTASRAAENPVAEGIDLLLQMQSGEGQREWPYEGVYRVQGEIPLGYRVGGTSIVASALLAMEGYDESAERKVAVARACDFVCEARQDALMNPEYAGGYDVRGWGYCYALRFLSALHARSLAPPEMAEEVKAAAEFYLSALQRIEIPEAGGWSYSRGAIAAPSPPAPFMTAPCVVALMEAKAAGFPVDEAVIERGLAVLERSRTAAGGIVYALRGDSTKSNDAVPGAVGRMLAAETVLHLAGKSSAAQVRSALDAFFTHWEWLEKRRQQTGTHVPPYQVAPYYFFYAHGWAGDAIELLPMHERSEYRRRLRELLMKVRDEDGGWNDRVFDRSAAYGTAIALQALTAQRTSSLPRWKAAAEGAAPEPASIPDARMR